jgi:hypothetical protein
LFIPQSLGNDLSERGARPFQEDVELIVIGAELLAFKFIDGVHGEYVPIFCDFIDSGFELAQTFLHEEAISEGEDLEQAVALGRPHESDGA